MPKQKRENIVPVSKLCAAISSFLNRRDDFVAYSPKQCSRRTSARGAARGEHRPFCFILPSAITSNQFREQERAPCFSQPARFISEKPRASPARHRTFDYISSTSGARE